MIIKAHSPAGFAEQYIVESIWNGRFPPGSILPAERELSELIGVTRTTLREVLQRLARDGWLTIQHGKPTKVNNFWESCGLNILETLARLNQEGIPELIDNLLSARTNISAIYIRGAIRYNKDKVVEALKKAQGVEEHGEAFSQFDYELNHEIALASNNPVYVLTLNGFRGLYSKIGTYFFNNSESRELARNYYASLLALAEAGDFEGVVNVVRQYGLDSGKIWLKIRDQLPQDLVE